MRAHSQPRHQADGRAERLAALDHAVVVTAAVVVLLPGGGDVLVVQVDRAVGLGEHVGAVGVLAAHRQEAAADDAVELAREAA